MQTINEATKNNCKNEVKEGEKTDALVSSREGMQQLVERTFKNGVEFAQRWISVKEELPVKCKQAFSNVVLVKSNDFENPITAYYDYAFNVWRWFGITDEINVTHWRPVEYPLL